MQHHSERQFETVSGAFHSIRPAAFEYSSIMNDKPSLFFVIIAPVDTDYLNKSYPSKHITGEVYAYVIALKEYTKRLGKTDGQQEFVEQLKNNNHMYYLVHGDARSLIIKMTEQKLVETILEPTFKLKESETSHAGKKPGIGSRARSMVGNVVGRLTERFNVPTTVPDTKPYVRDRARSMSSIFSKNPKH